MFHLEDLGVIQGSWKLKVFGQEGSREEFENHKIDGIGEYKATRSILIYGVLSQKIKDLILGRPVGVIKAVATANQSYSMDFKGVNVRFWNVRGTGITVLSRSGLGGSGIRGSLRWCISRSDGQAEAGEKFGDRFASYKGVVLNGIDGDKDQGIVRADYQGKGKGKMYGDEESNWVKVEEKKGGRDNRNKDYFRGEERGSSHRSAQRDRARNGAHKDRFSTESRGVRRERERSPRDYRDRNTSRRYEPVRNDRSRGIDQTEDQENREAGALVQVTTNNIERPSQEKAVDRLPAEDNLDLANEVLEAMYITERDEGMELDGVAPQEDLADAATEDDGFQDLTDTEGEVTKAVTRDSGVSEDVGAKDEVKEEGEIVQNTVEGEEGKKQGLKKKPFKAGTAAAGGTSKMRMVQAIIAQSKRISTKNGARQEEGSKKASEKGSLNPKASTSKK
ncbi:unnamed protein product [Eruca vesicaria subsp. sativa]|uniref:Uncharacterized protein n=1 Tax=Eruca vesicaria subsp. sativa TaxID=29727 RepID=A0ABC8MB39_ERUVS|nr:unnamed protein product [Eruca vesicaria subsp. sativa]